VQSFLFQQLDPRPHLLLDTFHKSREQFSNGLLVYGRIRQSGSKTGIEIEPLMETDLGRTLDSQQKSHFRLGKCRAFPMGQEVVWKVFRGHEVCMGELRWGVQNATLKEMTGTQKTGNFAENGKLHKNHRAVAGSVSVKSIMTHV